MNVKKDSQMVDLVKLDLLCCAYIPCFIKSLCSLLATDFILYSLCCLKKKKKNLTEQVFQ